MATLNPVNAAPPGNSKLYRPQLPHLCLTTSVAADTSCLIRQRGGRRICSPTRLRWIHSNPMSKPTVVPVLSVTDWPRLPPRKAARAHINAFTLAGFDTQVIRNLKAQSHQNVSGGPTRCTSDSGRIRRG